MFVFCGSTSFERRQITTSPSATIKAGSEVEIELNYNTNSIKWKIDNVYIVKIGCADMKEY